MTEGGLREAFAALPERGAGTAACPAPEVLWDAAAGHLSEAGRHAIIDHTTACADCALAWRVATDLGAGAAMAPTTWKWPLAARDRPWGWPLAATRTLLAAAAVLIVVAGVRVALRPADPATYRAAGSGAVASTLPADAPLPRNGFRLEWSAGSPGARYDVRVADEDLQILDRALALDAPHHVVPAAALAALPEGARVLWQVEVVLPDGRRVVSDTFAVRLTGSAGRR